MHRYSLLSDTSPSSYTGSSKSAVGRSYFHPQSLFVALVWEFCQRLGAGRLLLRMAGF